jgi:hypothetical protein
MEPAGQFARMSRVLANCPAGSKHQGSRLSRLRKRRHHSKPDPRLDPTRLPFATYDIRPQDVGLWAHARREGRRRLFATEWDQIVFNRGISRITFSRSTGLQFIALEELSYALRVIGHGPIRKIGTVHNLRYRHELRHSCQRNVVSDLSGVVMEALEFTVDGGASNLACIRGLADRLDEESVRKGGERASAVRPYPINILVLLGASAEDQAENRASI